MAIGQPIRAAKSPVPFSISPTASNVTALSRKGYIFLSFVSANQHFWPDIGMKLNSGYNELITFTKDRCPLLNAVQSALYLNDFIHVTSNDNFILVSVKSNYARHHTCCQVPTTV